MGVKVQLHFTGLCAFVPEKPIDQANNEATVLLVNARASTHGPHHTLFFAEPQFYQSTAGNRPHATQFDYNKPPVAQVKVCGLSGEVLTVVGRNAAGERIEPARDSLSFVTGLRPPGTVCPDANSATDFSWVAQSPCPLEPSVLTSTDASLLGVRMRLTQGALKCGGFRRTSRGIVRWLFGSTTSTALAEEVLYEMEFPDASGVTHVVVESTSFQGVPLPNLVLTPRPDLNLVEGWIVNMPLEGLLGIDPPRPMDSDHHYLEFYRFCRGPKPTTIPIPDPNSFCTAFIAASNPKCPPTVFSAVSVLSAIVPEGTIREPEEVSSSAPLAAKNPGHAH